MNIIRISSVNNTKLNLENNLIIGNEKMKIN